MNKIHNALIVAKSLGFVEWLFHNRSRQERAQNVPGFVDTIAQAVYT